MKGSTIKTLILIALLVVLFTGEVMAKGYIIIKSIGGVEIYIEGEFVGVTKEDDLLIEKSAGTYELLAKKEGYHDSTFEIKVEAFDSTTLTVDMEEVDILVEGIKDEDELAVLGIKTGSVEIRSIPYTGGDIRLNEQHVGETNSIFRNVLASTDIKVMVTYNNETVGKTINLKEDQEMLLLAHYGRSPSELIELFEVEFPGELRKGYYLEIEGEYITSSIDDISEPVTLMGSKHTIRINDGYRFLDYEKDIALNEKNVVSLLYYLDVIVDNGGQVTVDPELNQYLHGDEVSLKAIPSEGYLFSHWEGEVVDRHSRETSLIMKGDRSVTAVFEKKMYSLDIEVDSGGRVTVDPELNQYLHGDEVSLKATSFEGYMFSHWVGEVADHDSAETTITMDEDKTVTAYFEEVAPIEVWSFDGHTDRVLALAVDAEGYVYSGSWDNTVRKISPEGEEEWVFEEHTGDVHALAVDDEGYVYSGSGDRTVRKISPEGEEEWVFDGHTATVRALAVDAEGYVYSGSHDNTVRKISPQGDEIWSFDGHTEWFLAVAVDAEGYVYIGSGDNTIRKISPEGEKEWIFEGHNRDVRSLAVDAEGYVYSGSWDNTVRKISPEGEEEWVFDGHSMGVNAVAVDDEGYVYLGDSGGSWYSTVRKISPQGQQEWVFEGHTNNVRALVVDAEGYLYSGGQDNTVRKIGEE